MAKQWATKQQTGFVVHFTFPYFARNISHRTERTNRVTTTEHALTAPEGISEQACPRRDLVFQDHAEPDYALSTADSVSLVCDFFVAGTGSCGRVVGGYTAAGCRPKVTLTTEVDRLEMDFPRQEQKVQCTRSRSRKAIVGSGKYAFAELVVET